MKIKKLLEQIDDSVFANSEFITAKYCLRKLKNENLPKEYSYIPLQIRAVCVEGISDSKPSYLTQRDMEKFNTDTYLEVYTPSGRADQIIPNKVTFCNEEEYKSNIYTKCYHKYIEVTEKVSGQLQKVEGLIEHIEFRVDQEEVIFSIIYLEENKQEFRRVSSDNIIEIKIKEVEHEYKDFDLADDYENFYEYTHGNSDEPSRFVYPDPNDFFEFDYNEVLKFTGYSGNMTYRGCAETRYEPAEPPEFDIPDEEEVYDAYYLRYLQHFCENNNLEWSKNMFNTLTSMGMAYVFSTIQDDFDCRLPNDEEIYEYAYTDYNQGLV